MNYTSPKNSRSRKSRIFSSRIIFVALAVGLLLAIATTSAYMAVALTGAIFTTDSAGNAVNLNLYDTKADVFLNGGPKGNSGSGLPNGKYCVQVTSPSGDQLGQSAEGAVSVGTFESGKFDQLYRLTDILKTTSSGLTVAGYDSTGNPGDVYKVWVSSTCAFNEPDSKTDNFRIKEPVQPPQGNLKVVKFYDANANGTLELTDTPITGWQILVGETANFSLINSPFTTELNLPVAAGCYTAQEADATDWIHTGSIIKSVSVPGAGTGEIDFGNVCLGAGGGLTLGFWSNKNGQSFYGSDDNALLVSLNLRNANGSVFDPASYAAYRTWSLGATASNMAYMLSAQLAAMELNVLNGKVAGSAIVYAPGTGIPGNDFVSITNLMAAANTDLGTAGHENTTSGTPGAVFRARQEALKNALDKANNNLNFVQTAAQCGVGAGGVLTSPPTFSFDSSVSVPTCP